MPIRDGGFASHLAKLRCYSVGADKYPMRCLWYRLLRFGPSTHLRVTKYWWLLNCVHLKGTHYLITRKCRRFKAKLIPSAKPPPAHPELHLMTLFEKADKRVFRRLQNQKTRYANT